MEFNDLVYDFELIKIKPSLQDQDFMCELYWRVMCTSIYRDIYKDLVWHTCLRRGIVEYSSVTKFQADL